MALVTLKIRNTDLTLDCDDAERLSVLSGRLSRRMSEAGQNFNGASDIKLALMVALLLEDQLDAVLRKIEGEASSTRAEAAELKKAFNESMLQVADYIEQLANNIEKR